MLSDRCPVLSVMLVYCAQTAEWIKMKLGTEVGHIPGHIVLDEDPATPPPKGGVQPPPFSAHVCCDQTARCIKMPLGTEVGPGDIALGEDTAAPRFRPMYSGQTAGWIKMALGTELGLGPGDCVR